MDKVIETLKKIFTYEPVVEFIMKFYGDYLFLSNDDFFVKLAKIEEATQVFVDELKNEQITIEEVFLKAFSRFHMEEYVKIFKKMKKNQGKKE